MGRPVKLIWSREEEFLRDVLRPVAVVKFRAGLDADGLPVAIEAVSATEGPTEALAGKQGDKVDPTALEGLSGKAYAIANKRIAQVYVKGPAMLGYWRSVGNSLNDFFYESFLDELADKGGKDPFELRLHLLRDNARLTTLLNAVADLSGGWKRGPFTAEDGSKRARGVAMASPFGSHAAVIAEVSMENGQVKVHDIWQAIDPGSIVNPAIIEHQVNGAVALPVADAGGRSGLRGWQARAQLRPVPDPAAFAHGTGTCTHCRKRGEDGRHWRTATARSRTGSGQRGGATDRPARAQPANEPPHLQLTHKDCPMTHRFARTAGWLALPCLIAAALLAGMSPASPLRRSPTRRPTPPPQRWSAVANTWPGSATAWPATACQRANRSPAGYKWLPAGAIHATNITPIATLASAPTAWRTSTAPCATAWHPVAGACTRPCPTLVRQTQR